MHYLIAGVCHEVGHARIKVIINPNCVSTALLIKMHVMCLRGQPIPVIVVKCYYFQSNEHVFDSSSVNHRSDPLSGPSRKNMLDVNM